MYKDIRLRVSLSLSLSLCKNRAKPSEQGEVFLLKFMAASVEKRKSIDNVFLSNPLTKLHLFF
jgi:hypothetical protein